MTIAKAKKILKNWDSGVNLSNGYYVEKSKSGPIIWRQEDLLAYILHYNKIHYDVRVS